MECAERQDEAVEGAPARAREFAPSPYRDLAPDQVASDHRSKLRHIRNRTVGGIGAMLAITALAVVWGGASVAPVAVASFLLASGAALASERGAVSRQWSALTQVASADCDPAKLLRILDALGEKDRGAADDLLVWYGTCLALTGDAPAALDVARSLDSGTGARAAARTRRTRAATVARELNAASIRLTAAARSGDREGLASALAKAREVDGRLRPTDPLRVAAAALEAEGELELALADGDPAACEVPLRELASCAGTRLRHVCYVFDRARVREASGDAAAASADFSYVVEQGGTLALREEARAATERLSAG
ncbi:hypothetical protein VXJ25_05370 [Olsenella sp. YH-ols2223]|uniref:Tetratricopeptide repeat protein n=1 Tax=Olsenella absiana TaxID=3115222 RepID=A0ABU7RA05_9ACTN